MAFTTRRGRPRAAHDLDQRDTGTPELRQKRMLCLTTEVIDLLLEKQLISAEQHWCALHFRWLYTLRYGAPTPQSLDPARIKGIQHSPLYLEWQQEREQEWRIATHLLSSCKALPVVENCAVYNQFQSADINILNKGLSELSAAWCN